MSLPPRPVGDYESSFRQLSSVQQRQVGLIVGAAVADAAAHAHDGRSPSDIAACGPSDPLVFARGAAPAHSFTYLLQADLVRAMSAARGAFPPAPVMAAWASRASSASPRGIAQTERRVALVLGALLPLPAQYPWAADTALRQTAAPLADFAAQRDAAVRDAALSALGVALRCLQDGADPTRNAAITSLPGADAAFPEDVAALCPKADPPAHGLSGADTVREALAIARGARGFDDGVRAAIRLGGPVSQRSLIVGALVGARLGVRCVPTEWIGATHDHVRVVARAIDVAQWSWNPVRR